MTNPFLPYQNVDTVPRQRVTDLSADLDLQTGSACPGSVSTKKDRTRIHVRLARIFPDVEMILANWSAAQKCAENIVKAIRLMDAINKGDLAAALDTCPELGLLIDRRPPSRQKRTPLPSYKTQESNTDSESKRDPEEESAVQALASKLETLTGDVRKAKLRATAELLYDRDNPFTTADLDTWNARVWPDHWKAKKGQARPDLAAIEETIGQVRALPVIAPAMPQKSAETNRYLLHEQSEPDFIPDPVRPPIPAYKGPYSSVWFLVRDELEWVMGSTAFVCYLRPLNLVQVDGSRFVFVAPDDYRADEHTKRTVQHSIEVRIEKYQRPALPAGSIHVEILLESEYHP